MEGGKHVEAKAEALPATDLVDCSRRANPARNRNDMFKPRPSTETVVKDHQSFAVLECELMNAFHLDAQDSAEFRILGFSDTYGVEAGNGVGRFLQDLHCRAQRDRLPLSLVIPGREVQEPGLLKIRAPAFQVPGYGKLQIAAPLEHHRKTIERHVKEQSPDCIHVSTPGPFGGFGLVMARRFRIPLVGIYHTDFPAFAREIASGVIRRVRRDPLQTFGPLVEKLLPLVLPHFQRMQEANPNLEEDLSNISSILERNASALTSSFGDSGAIAHLAELAATEAMRRFYKRFTMVLARSLDQMHELEQTLSIASGKLRCLCPGTDVERFHPQRADRNVWREYGISPDAFVSLYVGRVTAEKNIDFLIDCWNRVQRGGHLNRHLVVVGHGEHEDLQRLAATANVHVVGSHHGEQLSRLYASADLLLFPSITETLGQVGLEAGASGLPVIVADRGGQKMYVEDGTTGRVLPVSDAQQWADQIERFARDDRNLAKRYGEAARRYIVENFTIEHSIKSYWDLHREAAELHRAAQRKQPQKRSPPFIPASKREQIPRQGLMIISDYHAGRHFSSKRERNDKLGALESMLAMALERNLEVIFAGDFGDHGARASRLEADFQAFRSVRRNLGFDGNPLFLRGNHDYGYSDAQLCDWTGGCRVHSSLVYFHPQAGITVTHGHILALAKTVDVIRSTVGPSSMLAQLREDLLDNDLKPSVIAYDVANLIESTLTQHGLTGLGTLWEGLYPTRAALAEKLLEFTRQTSRADQATWKMVAGLVGTHDNVNVAGLLGAACGGWASIFGHTHEPLAKRKRIQIVSGTRSAQVVANSGNVNRKRPSCAVGLFPEVTIYRYDTKKKTLAPSRSAFLSKSDVDDYLRRAKPSQIALQASTDIKQAS